MKKQAYFIAFFVFFSLFIVFTVLLKIVDVRAVGPFGGFVGFASLNVSFRDLVGVHTFWYHLTQVLGYVAILLGFSFGVLGAAEWIARKSLKAVDAELLLSGALYVLLGIAYVLFEVVVINERPVALSDHPEASYPSSHTVLALSVFLAAIAVWRKLLPDTARRAPISAGLIVLAALALVGRLLSGVHWLTDIIGGVLLSGALVSLYFAVLTVHNEKKENLIQNEN